MNTGRSDRTLTAMLSPFADRDRPTAAVLLLAARAGEPMPPPERRFVILGAELEIGRRPSSGPAPALHQLWLDDALVSGRHAHLARGDDGWTIADLGSKNGTFVEGRRLERTTRLMGGDRVFVGGQVFVFRQVTSAELEALQAELANPLAPVPTSSPTLALLCDKLRKLAVSDAELLLVGETGVGKEVYARAIHAASGRKGRLLALNCAAIPRELVESELFGYRPGAHSTAAASKPGLLEEAEGGTLFLDEVGEMALDVQTKLLRFLQDKELTPLGSTRPRRLDVRVLAATNRPIGPGSDNGVRDDLLARLGAAPFLLPPLRDRIEDLGALADHFLAQARAARGAATPVAFDNPALRALALHRWPMNVRELEKIVVAAAALAGQERLIGLGHLPQSVTQPAHRAPTPPPGMPDDSIDALRPGRKSPEPPPSVEELESLLIAHKGNVADVSRALGRQRAAVWRWIKRFGLGPDKYRAP